MCTSDAKEKTHLAGGRLYPGILSHTLASAFPVWTSIEYFDLGRLCPETEIECCLCGSMEMNNLVHAEVPHYLFHYLSITLNKLESTCSSGYAELRKDLA